MLTHYGWPLLVWLHNKVCRLDHYLYSWVLLFEEE